MKINCYTTCRHIAIQIKNTIKFVIILKKSIFEELFSYLVKKDASKWDQEKSFREELIFPCLLRWLGRDD